MEEFVTQEDTQVSLSGFWKYLKEAEPERALAISLLPVAQQVAAVLDYQEAMAANDSPKGVMAAIGLIPGFGLTKYGSRAAPAIIDNVISRISGSAPEKALAAAVKNAPRINMGSNAEQIGEYALSKGGM